MPEGLSDEVACPASCATATVAAAFEAAGAIEGRTVLVLGCGLLGVTAAAWARALGAEAVIACEKETGRLAIAGAFGASHRAGPEALTGRIDELTGGYGVDVVFEMTGAAESVGMALGLSRVGGTVVLVGSVFPTRAVPIEPETLVRRCLTIRGVHNYAPGHLLAALEFLAGHPEYPFGRVVSCWVPLEGVEGALGTAGLRVGVRPGG